jgi:hypothetical protein
MRDRSHHDLPEKDWVNGFLTFWRNFFQGKPKFKEATQKVDFEKEINLEPKYWPQVKHFMDELNHIVKVHTIDDSNIQDVNRRILDYVEKQINLKGSLHDIEERYTALDMLADRILIKNLSKIVGLKHNDSTRAEFSEAVETFKKSLHERHDAEVLHHKQNMGH